MSSVVLTMVSLTGQLIDLAGFALLTSDLLPEYTKYRRHRASVAALGLVGELLSRGYRRWAKSPEEDEDWFMAHPDISGMSEKRAEELLAHAAITDEEWDSIGRLLPLGTGGAAWPRDQRKPPRTVSELAGDAIALNAHDHMREMFWPGSIQRPNLYLGIALVAVGAILTIVATALQLLPVSLP